MCVPAFVYMYVCHLGRSTPLNLLPYVHLLAASLTIKHKWLILLTCRLADLSVGLSVCLSEKYTVATWLNGSRCHLG